MKTTLPSLVLSVATLTASLGVSAQDRLKVGVSGGDGEVIWAKVTEVAKRQGLDVMVITFNDHLLPNAALDAGDLDANAFQHRPFLENQIKSRGYKIVAVADTIVEPIGLYSLRYKAVAELPDGAILGIPNDPSNGGRVYCSSSSRASSSCVTGWASCPASGTSRAIIGNSSLGNWTPRSCHAVSPIWPRPWSTPTTRCRPGCHPARMRSPSKAG